MNEISEIIILKNRKLSWMKFLSKWFPLFHRIWRALTAFTHWKMFHRNVTTWKLGFENFVLFMKMINLNSMVSFQYRCDFVVLVDIPLRSGALEPSVLTSRKDIANGCIWSHTSVVKAKFSVCKTSDLLQHLVPSVLGSGISTLVYIEALELL